MGNEPRGNMQFSCGRCEALLTVKHFLAGKKINCPKCHKKVVVPKKEGGVADMPDALSAQPGAATGEKNTGAPAGKGPATRKKNVPGQPPGQNSELKALRAENKALRDRLERQTKTAPPAASGQDDALAAARKRITDLEQQLSQARTEVEGARARAASAIRDRKEKL